MPFTLTSPNIGALHMDGLVSDELHGSRNALATYLTTEVAGGSGADSSRPPEALRLHPPGGHFIIYLCSGRRRKGDLCAQLGDFITVISIDMHIDARHNLLDEHLVRQLCALASDDNCIGVVATPNCRTFSAAQFNPLPGIRGPVRDLDNRDGILQADGSYASTVIDDNLLTKNCIRIMTRCGEHGGFGLFENPPHRREGSQYRGGRLAIKGRDLHCSFWDYTPVKEYSELRDMRDTTFDQCKTRQGGSQKTTVLRSTPVIYEYVDKRFRDLICDHSKDSHEKTLVGFDSDGELNTRKSEEFSPDLNHLLGLAIIEFHVGWLSGTREAFVDDHMFGGNPEPNPSHEANAPSANVAATLATGLDPSLSAESAGDSSYPEAPFTGADANAPKRVLRPRAERPPPPECELTPLPPAPSRELFKISSQFGLAELRWSPSDGTDAAAFVMPFLNAAFVAQTALDIIVTYSWTPSQGWAPLTVACEDLILKLAGFPNEYGLFTLCPLGKNDFVARYQGQLLARCRDGSATYKAAVDRALPTAETSSYLFQTRSKRAGWVDLRDGSTDREGGPKRANTGRGLGMPNNCIIDPEGDLIVTARHIPPLAAGDGDESETLIAMKASALLVDYREDYHRRAMPAPTLISASYSSQRHSTPAAALRLEPCSEAVWIPLKRKGGSVHALVERGQNPYEWRLLTSRGGLGAARSVGLSARAILTANKLKPSGKMHAALTAELSANTSGSAANTGDDSLDAPPVRVWSTFLDESAVSEASSKAAVWMPVSMLSVKGDTRRGSFGLVGVGDEVRRAVDSAIGDAIDGAMDSIISDLSDATPDALTLLQAEEDTRRAAIKSQIDRKLHERAFRSAYATNLMEQHKAQATARSDGGEPEIDFLQSRYPAWLTDAGLTTTDDRLVPLPDDPAYRLLADTCGGQGMIGTQLLDWLQRHDPGRVTVREVLKGVPINGAVTGASMVVTMQATIKGITVAGVRLPTLKNIPVVSGFPGLLLPIVLLESVNCSIDMGQGTATLQGYASDGVTPAPPVTTPISTDGEGSVDMLTLLTSNAAPVIYLDNAVRIDAMDNHVVDCRAPAHIPEGTEVFLHPLSELRERDIGALPSYGRVRVKDGRIRCVLVNPHRQTRTVAGQTALASVTVLDPLAMPPPEYTVDQIMDGVNIGPTADREMVRKMLEPRTRLAATTPGYINGIQCHIDTPGVDAHRQRPPRSGQVHWGAAQMEQLRPVIDAQVEAGYLTRTQSDFTSRPLLVPKPDGTWRLTVNYKDLNDLCVGDHWPLPNIQDNLDSISKAKWFTVVDLLAGFHQIEMHPDSVHKTAFQTPWGQYAYLRMPMGLKSAPSTFCRMVDAMLAGLPPNIAFPYVDDLLIATDGTFEDHMRDVGMVFDRLLEGGATAKLSKIYIGFEEAPYLGFLVGRNGTRLDPAKTAPLREITLHRLLDDPKHPARFVGMLQWFSKYIPNFANLAAPFYEARNLTGQARRDVIYSLRAQCSFALLMHALEHAVTLARPDWNKPFVVATDASAYGAGAVLAQIDDDGLERPIAFWSHRFTKDERGWSVPDREGWALRTAVKHFRVYLVGREFNAYTDQGSLKYLMTHNHPEDSKRQRWAAELQGYADMHIHHRPGVDNVVPDAISRLCMSMRLHDVDARLRHTAFPPDAPSDSAGALADSNDVLALPTLDDVPDFGPSRAFAMNPEFVRAQHACRSSAGPSAAEGGGDGQREDTSPASSASSSNSHLSASVPNCGVPGASRDHQDGQSGRACATHHCKIGQDTQVASTGQREDTPPASYPASDFDQAPRQTLVTQAARTSPESSDPNDPHAQSAATKIPRHPSPPLADVGVVFTDGSRILLHHGLDGSLLIPGGPSKTVGARTYRAAARMHFNSITKGMTDAASEALEKTAYYSKHGDAMFFVCRLGEGVAAFDPERSEKLEWVHLDDITLNEVTMSSDRAMIKRLIAAKGGGHGVERLRDTLNVAPPAPRNRAPTSESARTLAHDASGISDSRAFADGPALHDGPDTARVALTAISQAIEEDPERVLAVDLEGLLRVGGFISLIQVAVHRPDGSRVIHVFDILADDSPITGQGYDAPGAPRSLRALLEDESIVKVLHCCRGDSTALWYSSGVRLLNVFDTDVGDAIVNKRHVNKQRGLQKVLHQHAGMHATLQLKDSVQHNMGALWLQRPVSAENFQYAYEDVLYLREAYIAMKTKLVEDSLLDLAFCHSRQRCPPYCWPPSHPYSESPRVAVIALHDGQSVATLSLDGDQAALPLIDCVNHKWGSAWQGGLRRRAIETWKRRFGEPIGPLKQALDSHLRSPIRIGDAYVLELFSPRPLHSLRLNELLTEPHDTLHILSLERLCTEWCSDDRLKLTAQCLRHLMNIRAPPVDDSTADGQPATLVTVADVPPKRASILIRDATHGIMVTHATLGLAVPDALIDAGQRPVDAAMRALHFGVGPVAEVTHCPHLHHAIHKALEKDLYQTTFKDMVIIDCPLELERPLSDYASTVAAARVQRLKDQPKRSGILDAAIYPLARVYADRAKCSPLLRTLLGRIVNDPSPRPDSSESISTDSGGGSTAHPNATPAVTTQSPAPLSLLTLALQTCAKEQIVPDYSLITRLGVAHQYNECYLTTPAAKNHAAVQPETVACAKDARGASRLHQEDVPLSLTLALDDALAGESVHHPHGLGWHPRGDPSSQAPSDPDPASRVALSDPLHDDPVVAASERRGETATLRAAVIIQAAARARFAALGASRTRQLATRDGTTPFAQSLRAAIVIPAAARARITSRRVARARQLVTNDLQRRVDVKLGIDSAGRLVPGLPRSSPAANIDEQTSRDDSSADNNADIESTLFGCTPHSAPAADSLSIHPDDVTPANGTGPLPLPTVSALSAAQETDDFAKNILEYHRSGCSRVWVDENITIQKAKAFIARADTFKIITVMDERGDQSPLLCFIDPLNYDGSVEYQAGGKPRIYVPTSQREAFISAYHIASGHSGVTRTLGLLTPRYWWTRMSRSVRAFIHKCHVCAFSKVPRHRAGEAHRMDDGDHPWDSIVVDLYSYEKVDEYDHVLVIVDRFSRGVSLTPVKGTPDSKQVLDIIMAKVIVGHRTTPRVICSDAGSNLISALCQEFWECYGTILTHSTAEHHNTAGLAERANSTLHDQLISHRLSSGDKRWYLYVDQIELAMNSCVNATTGYSPTYVEYGREARLPLDVAFYGLHSNHRCVTDYVRQHCTRMHEIWDDVRVRLGLHALALKKTQDDRKDCNLKFEVHDRVLLRKAPGHAKWEEPYHGPYRIAEVLERDNYRLRDLHSRRLLDVVHVERLAPYPSATNHGDNTMGADEEFVQRILDRRPHPSGEGFVYKVRWRGKPSSEDSWLTLEDLANCHDLVRAYNTNIDPLVLAPSVLPLEPLPGEVLKPTPPEPKPTFRRHPDRQGVTTGDEEEQATEPADARPPPQAHILDAALEPAISEGTNTFIMKDVLQVRPKGAGHEVEMSWENTWVPLDLLSPTACDRVRAFALEHHPDVTIPLGAGSASGHNDVSKVLAVRTGPSGPEAHVAWEPAWWLYSNLPSKSKAEAKAVIASMLDELYQRNSAGTLAVATDGNTDLSASRIQACARGMLDRTMFRGAQGAMSGPIWLAPNTFNRRGDPRAVGQIGDKSTEVNGSQRRDYRFYLGQDGGRRDWTADDDLTAAERRRCRTLLKELGLPVV